MILYRSLSSERRHRRKQHLNGQSDVSGSLKNSDGADDHIKEGKVSSYDEKDVLEEQVQFNFILSVAMPSI